MKGHPREQLRKAGDPIARLEIRVNAVHAVLDDLLADPVGLPMRRDAPGTERNSGSAEELLSIAADLEDEIREQRESHQMELLQAKDWARRAEIATETGREDLAALARHREHEHRSAAELLQQELAALEAEHGACLTAASRVAGLASARPHA